MIDPSQSGDTERLILVEIRAALIDPRSEQELVSTEFEIAIKIEIINDEEHQEEQELEDFED